MTWPSGASPWSQEEMRSRAAGNPTAALSRECSSRRIAAETAAGEARYHASRLRQMLAMMAADPSLACTISEAITSDAIKVHDLAIRAVQLAILAHEARRELDAAKGYPKP